MGMNRDPAGLMRAYYTVPHVRGDEPDASGTAVITLTLFPTCVGMNRPQRSGAVRHAPVPHVRGDEPNPALAACACLPCSPRAWG